MFIPNTLIVVRMACTVLLSDWFGVIAAKIENPPNAASANTTIVIINSIAISLSYLIRVHEFGF